MQRNNKVTSIKLWSLLLIFAIPLFMGWFIFHNYYSFQFKTTNYGKLVQPAIHVSDLVFTQGGHTKWQIVYAPATCDSGAEKEMYLLHQLHTALGKNQDRVSLTWITNAACQQDAHDFRKLIFTKKQLTRLSDNLQEKNQVKFKAAGKIYLVDPLGNLFMYYSSGTDPMGILKDIKKVLEVSQIG